MSEPWTQDQFERARMNDWAPYGSEDVWCAVMRRVRHVVDGAPPLTESQHARLRILLWPRGQ